MVYIRKAKCFKCSLFIFCLLAFAACSGNEMGEESNADLITRAANERTMNLKIDSIIKLSAALDTLPELDNVFIPAQLNQVEQQLALIHHLQSLIREVTDSGNIRQLDNFQEISAAVDSRYAGLKAQFEAMEEMRGNWERAASAE